MRWVRSFMYVSKERKNTCHTKVWPYLVSVLQRLSNRIREAKFGREMGGNFGKLYSRACCCADCDTDAVNNRIYDVLTCAFLLQDLTQIEKGIDSTLNFGHIGYFWLRLKKRC